MKEVTITLSETDARHTLNTLLRASVDGIDSGVRNRIRIFSNAVYEAENRDNQESAATDCESAQPHDTNEHKLFGRCRLCDPKWFEPDMPTSPFGDVLAQQSAEIGAMLARAQEQCLIRAIIDAGYEAVPHARAQWRKHIAIECHPHMSMWYVTNDGVAMYRIELDMSDFANIAIRTRKV